MIAAVLPVALALPTPAYADTYNTYNTPITNFGGGLNADVMWGSTAVLQGVFLWPDNGNASQRFDLIATTDGYFRIRARHSGQCLVPDGRTGSKENGVRIVQIPYQYCMSTAAEWQRISINGRLSLLRNHATRRCLDAANSSGGVPGVQAVLQQWDCITTGNEWNAYNQLWTTN